MFHHTYLLVVKALSLNRKIIQQISVRAPIAFVSRFILPTHTLFRCILSDNNIVITHSSSIVHRRSKTKVNLVVFFVLPDCCGVCENVASSGNFSFLLQRVKLCINLCVNPSRRSAKSANLFSFI